MKKIVTAAILSAALIGATHAATTVGLDLERVKDSNTGVVGQAQVLRVNSDFKGMGVGLQVRSTDSDRVFEATLGKKFGMVTAFGGLAHNNGLVGNADYNYAVVGASAGAKIGPVQVTAGVKTRVNWNEANPDQTTVFAGASYPLARSTNLVAGVSKSYRGIEQSTMSVGLSYAF